MGQRRSPLQDTFYRFLQNRAAVLGAIFIVLLVSVAIFAPAVAPYSFDEQDLIANNAVPGWMIPILPEGAENYANVNSEFPLGADHLGRDLLSRTIYGARVSLWVAVIASMVSLVIGTVYGMISGYMGGWMDNVLMRIVDFIYAFPALIVVILLQTYFKAVARRGGQEGIGAAFIELNNEMGGLMFLFIALGLINWIGMARLARGQVLANKSKEYVEAARSIGASDVRIITYHLFPNIIGPLIVAETLAIPGYIFTEAFLSFIGLGVNPPTPSWGIMISEGVQTLRTYPNQVFVPAIALSLTTLAFNFVGDGLRDAFDPKRKR